MEAVETAAATASVTRIEVKNGIYQNLYLTEIRHSTKVPHGQKSH